jgi:DNA-binding NtrC family response regulator
MSGLTHKGNEDHNHASSRLRVLFVEDTEDFVLLLIRELRKGGFEIDYSRVDTPEDTCRALEEETWDLVLTDYIMPRFSAPDVLILVREKGVDVPVIVVTGKIKEGLAPMLMGAGARDFISKQNLSRLVPAVKREMECFSLRRRLRQS